MGNGVVESTGVRVNMTCPAALDIHEPGGAYSVYTSTLVDGDTLQTVTCAPL